MTTIHTVLGLIGCASGCLCLYLSSPHQRLRAAPWPPVPARAAAAMLLPLAWLAFAQVLRPLTATFVLVTLAMLLLSVLPYAGALRRRPGASR